MALILLNIFYGLIGIDLTLRRLGQEVVIAGIVSLVEGAGGWLIVSIVPAAARALFIPALIVALIYKVSHLEDWSRYDVVLLLAFQTVIVCLGLSLFYGHFQAAIMILVVFGGILALIGSIAKSL